MKLEDVIDGPDACISCGGGRGAQAAAVVAVGAQPWQQHAVGALRHPHVGMLLLLLLLVAVVMAVTEVGVSAAWAAAPCRSC